MTKWLVTASCPGTYIGIFIQGDKWATVSQQAKDLLAIMLHISPQRRPTAAQLLNHPWLSSHIYSTNQHVAYLCQNAHSIAQVPEYSLGMEVNNVAGDKAQLKETIAATFRAIATSPQAAHLGPVVMSELARRRFKDKGVLTPQCT